MKVATEKLILLAGRQDSFVRILFIICFKPGGHQGDRSLFYSSATSDSGR